MNCTEKEMKCNASLKLVVMFFAALAVSACSPEENPNSRFPQAGIAAGGLYLELPAGSSGLEISHGIDSMRMQVTLAECEGIEMQIEMRNSNAELAFAEDHGAQLRDGIFRDLNRSNRYLYFVQRINKWPQLTVIDFVADEESCARDFIESHLFRIDLR